MKTRPQLFDRHRSTRNGVTLVLVTVLSVAMLSLGALVLNTAYVEVTRTHLRATADAAAKAALVRLSETQSKSEARAAARQMCADNAVMGRQMLLYNSDILFGSAVKDANGSYQFVENAQPLNSVQVQVGFGGETRNGAMSVYLSSFISPASFEGSEMSRAGRFDHDICIVVDRSASMAWDLSDVDFAYPAEQADDSSLQNYFRPPHPTASRWGALVDAVRVFDTVMSERDLNPQVAVVSYSSDYTFGLFHSDQVTVDQPLTREPSRMLTALDAIAAKPLIGDTNIAAGLLLGRQTLLDISLRRQTANRTIILLTDGVRTEGNDPMGQVTTLNNNRVTVHTITFSNGADQDAMSELAAATGGNHYHAATADELRAAFSTIARELPATLTF